MNIMIYAFIGALMLLILASLFQVVKQSKTVARNVRKGLADISLNMFRQLANQNGSPDREKSHTFDLKSYYLQHFETNVAQVELSRKSFSLLRFIELVREYFDSVVVVDSYVNENEGIASIILEANLHGEVAMMKIAFKIIKFNDVMDVDGTGFNIRIKEKPNFRYVDMLSGAEMSEYLKSRLLGDKNAADDEQVAAVMVCHDMSVVYPDPNERNTSIKLKTIKEARKQSLVKLKHLEIKVTGGMVYSNIIFSDGRYSKRFTKFRGLKLKPEQIESHYAPALVTYKGEQGALSMDKAMQFMLMGLQDGQSIAMRGAPGTGKTVAQRYMANELAKSANINVYEISSTLFERLDTPEFAGSADDIFNPNMTNVLIIDQAETIMSNPKESKKMLTMIDGHTRDRWNLVFLIVYNGDPEDMNSALFRSGRLFDVEIRPLPSDTAQAAANYIEKNLPEGKSFDWRAFEKTKKSNDKYASAGNITIAQIYECVVSDERDRLFEAFQKETAKKK